jgi:hypothetical protein
MPEAKERPILFNGPMVRAVLDGRTRRALNAQSLKEIGYGVQLGECHELPADGQVHPNSASYYAELCPFGLPGDRLWVRETFALLGNEDGVCIDWNDHVQKGDERQAARIYRAAAVSGILACGRFLIRPTGSRRPKACSTRALGVRAFTCPAGPAASCWKSPMCA